MKIAVTLLVNLSKSTIK